MDNAPADAKVIPPAKPQANLFALLKPYSRQVGVLAVCALAANALGLWLPKIVSRGIDGYARGTADIAGAVTGFVAVSVAVFVFAALQAVVQTYAAERVARDLREKVVDKISRQSHAYVQKSDPSKLLSTLTGDVDSVKLFVSQAFASIISSVVLIIGASALLLHTNWKLALAVLVILPIMGATFFMTLARVRKLFLKSRESIDRLNKVINESILGAALVRVLGSRSEEAGKFATANATSRDLGYKILNMFAGMIPAITFIANLATLAIVALGGKFIIGGSMSLGDFAAFNSYLAILIFPIFVLGFMGTLISQAQVAYQRVREVLDAPDAKPTGTFVAQLRGDIDVKNVTVAYGEKRALKDASFSIRAGTKTAIVGPTAAGKSQLLYVLAGLIDPDEGVVEYDGRPVAEYEQEALHRQIGFVLQDSVLFNMTLRENVTFGDTVTPESFDKAVATAELADFIGGLADGADAVVSERGTSLSGGQKQRVMLARALAMGPKVLLLDDFTARVDAATEGRILGNVEREYPGITLVSVTQKVSSVEHYDQIIVLMEGEVIATGTHQHLLATCPEYVQIFESQRSTDHL
jgi:ATP-binding cassette subfamily B protein